MRECKFGVDGMKIAKRKTVPRPNCCHNLMLFYNVWNAGQLIAAQQKHILRLQTKLNNGM